MNNVRCFLENRGANKIKKTSFGFVVNDKFIVSKEHMKSNLPVVVVSKNLTLKNLCDIGSFLNINIQESYDELFKEYDEDSFYCYSHDQLKKSFDKLLRTNNPTGGHALIRYFHKKGILNSHKNGKKTPLESIKNNKDLHYVILNRMIYSKKIITPDVLLDGLTVSQRAPKVSVFSPVLAKNIISCFAEEAKTIVDPFSGFSGRMLAACALNKSYVGSDIREQTIEEAKQMLLFLKKEASLSTKDFLDFDTKGDLLLTCPPYANKEIWDKNTVLHDEDFYIERLLEKKLAKKYIFIVKNTKFEKNIVKEIKNGSWYKSNITEKVLLFNT